MIPGEAEHALGVFLSITGPEPLTWLEIAAYCDLTGEKLEPWETTALVRMDRAMRDEQFRRSRPPKDGVDG